MNLKRIKEFFKRNAIALLMTFGIFMILIGVVFIVFFMRKNVDQYKVEKAQTYIYFDQMKFEYNTEMTLDASSGITKLKLDKEEVDLGSQPIFYKGLQKVIFPQEMAVVFPLTNGTQKKVPKFSQLDASEGGTYIKNTKLNYSLETAFLYDGNDLYFFLEDTTISLGPDYKIVLPAFSYAVYNFNKELYLYHYEEDQMYYLAEVVDQVVASTDKYTINLSIDSLEYNQKSRLLMKNFSYLSKLK